MPFRYHFDEQNNSRGSITLFSGDTMSFFVRKDKMEADIRGSEKWKDVDITLGNEHRIVQNVTIESGSLAKHIFDDFFRLTGGEIYELAIHCRLDQDEENEHWEEILSEILAGRRIKVTMFRQQFNHVVSMNSKLCQLVRNHVDFKMFGTCAAAAPYHEPLVVTEKMLKCEFLNFDIRLANSEAILEKFKGWGLNVLQPDKNLDFDFLYAIFEKWYSGEETQWEYLCLAVEISFEKCKSLISLGKQIEIEKKGKKLVELEITREDGEFCRFGRLPLTEEDEKKSKDPRIVYFYIGECTDELVVFNAMKGRVL